MATLRFYARHDHRVWYPGLKIPNGQAPIYLGRTHVPGDGATGKPSQSPATKEPIECEAGSEVANRIIRLMTIDSSDPPFFCADQATADATGLQFVKAKFSDGVWVEAPAVGKPSPTPE